MQYYTSDLACIYTQQVQNKLIKHQHKIYTGMSIIERADIETAWKWKIASKNQFQNAPNCKNEEARKKMKRNETHK